MVEEQTHEPSANSTGADKPENPTEQAEVQHSGGDGKVSPSTDTRIKAFTSTFIFCLFSSLLLFALKEMDYQPLLEMEDSAMAMIDRLRSNTSGPLVGPAFVFVKVDEETHQAWEKPFPLPRDKLTKLLQSISQGCPATIILDVVLDSPPSSHETLKIFLQSYGGGFQYCKGRVPPIILTRKSWRAPNAAIPKEDMRSICRREATTSQPDWFRIDRKSIFIEDDQLSEHIVWGTTPFFEGADRRVQCWALWETVRSSVTDSGRKYFSVPVLAKLFWLSASEPSTASSPRELVNRVAEGLGKCRELDTCDSSFEISALDLASSDRIQRLFFRIPYDTGGRTRPTVYDPSDKEKRVSVLASHSAMIANQLGESTAYSGRIVVIGASYEDSGDWYDTSLGTMPGAIMLINAMNQFATDGPIPALTRAEWRWFTAGVFLLVALLLSLTVSLLQLGEVLAGLLITLPLIFFGYKAQPTGYSPPFTIPLFMGAMNTLLREGKDLVIRILVLAKKSRKLVRKDTVQTNPDGGSDERKS